MTLRTVLRLLACVPVIAIIGCSSGGSNSTPMPTNPSTALSLAWSAGSQAQSTQVAVSLPGPGPVTITPSGTAPYQAEVLGNCATLVQLAYNATFVVNGTSGSCTLVVQDAAGRSRALLLEFLAGPARAFLDVSPSGLPDTSGTIHLTVNQSLSVTINEPLVFSSFNAPYSIAIQGSCVTASSVNTPLSGSATATLTAVSAGQCVAVYADAAGTTTAWNLTVN